MQNRMEENNSTISLLCIRELYIKNYHITYLISLLNTFRWQTDFVDKIRHHFSFNVNNIDNNIR